MELIIKGKRVELLPGDTVIAQEGEYLIISAKGFDLSDEGSEANYIMVDVKQGDMEGYLHDLDELWQHYKIEGVKHNENSLARYVRANS